MTAIVKVSVSAYWVVDSDSAMDALLKQGYCIQRREVRHGVTWVLMVKENNEA